MKAIQKPTTIYSRTNGLKIKTITKILCCGDNANQQQGIPGGSNVLQFHEFPLHLLPSGIQITKFYKTKGRFAICQTNFPNTILVIGQFMFGNDENVFGLKKFDSEIVFADGGNNFFVVQTKDNKIHILHEENRHTFEMPLIQCIDSSYDVCFVQTADGKLHAFQQADDTVIYDSAQKSAKLDRVYMGADHGFALLENDNMASFINGNIHQYFERKNALNLQQDESVLQMSVTYYTTTVLTSKNRVYFLNTKNRSGPERPMGAGQVAWLENSVKQVHAVVTVDGRVEVVGENAYGECALGHASPVTDWTDITDKIEEHKAPNEKILQFVLAGWTTYVVLGELQESSMFSQTYHTGTHQKRNQFADIELICL